MISTDGSRSTRPAVGVLAVPDATRKGNQAYDLMRRAIVACRLLPGTRFTEAEAMERFGIGKASCRIALQRLAQDGFVSSMPRHGYRVSPVTAALVAE